jgi:Oligosaccharyl transferase STT3 subunit
MPLYIAWAIVASLNERSVRRASLLAFVAALLTGLYAAIWRGWLFTYVVVVCAALGCSILAVVRRARRGDFRRVWTAPEVRSAFTAFAVYCLVSGVFTWTTDTSPFYGPFRMFNTSLQEGGAASRGLWPVAFTGVSELGKPLAMDVAQFMGGLFFFFLGWLGLLSLILPETRLKTRHIALSAWILALFAVRYYLFAAAELPRSVFFFLFAAPFAAELLIRAEKKEPPPADEAAVVLVVLWFFTSLEQVYGGIRFLILFAPPFALAFGAFAGRIQGMIEKFLERPLRRHAALAAAVSWAVALSLVLYPLQRGYTTMRDYYPAMNDAWWDSLVKIKNESTADAIVNSWWDYGYWAKYAAERRVTSDGGSLTTHVPHWLAKAFVAPSDAESRGILRMLDCGSDATPLPEGRYGAMGKLNAVGLGDYRAYGFLTDLFKLDRTTAMHYLTERGFSAERQATLLAATHCRPPPAFFVVSKEMIAKGEWWMGLGSWDVRRAYLAKRTRQLPEAQAVEDLVRLGYRAAESKALYDIVGRLKTEADIEEFIAPAQRLIPTDWIPCHEVENGMSCQISITNIEGVSRFEFVYDPAAPKNGRLREPGREAAPAALLVAGGQALDESLDSRSPFPTIGVLLDVAGRRILVGSPLLIRSTLVRLFYLNGRYSRIFQPFERKRTLLDDEVATFKIDWGE